MVHTNSETIYSQIAVKLQSNFSEITQFKENKADIEMFYYVMLCLILLLGVYMLSSQHKTAACLKSWTLLGWKLPTSLFEMAALTVSSPPDMAEQAALCSSQALFRRRYDLTVTGIEWDYVNAAHSNDRHEQISELSMNKQICWKNKKHRRPSAKHGAVFLNLILRKLCYDRQINRSIDKPPKKHYTAKKNKTQNCLPDKPASKVSQPLTAWTLHIVGGCARVRVCLNVFWH